MRPLCFVLMPFGIKPDTPNRTIDFDAVYREIIAPAIEQAGMEPLRADEEFAGGIIHKPMFERLVLCEYAVADLTSANANVFYELGVRHAVRPHTSVLMFAEGGPLPFDVKMLRALPYRLGADGKPENAAASVALLSARLTEARAPSADSPLYQLLTDYPKIQHEKTDVFRERVAYAKNVKQQLTQARRAGKPDRIRAIEAALEQQSRSHGGGGINDTEAGVLVDLLLSYRAVEAWDDMVALVDKLARPLSDTALVREQYAFALNRAKRGADAAQILNELIDQQGPSSERCGLLGRIYKDEWQAARDAGQKRKAAALLDQAIATYRRGFESDWRDAFPGVNVVTLMERREPPDDERFALLPIVRYAAERRAHTPKADYWDFATLLELAVLSNDQAAAMQWLGKALMAVREVWEPKTTLRNLRLIKEARQARGAVVAWLDAVEAELEAAAQGPHP